MDNRGDRRVALWLVLALCALGFGCKKEQPDTTVGELGRVEFKFQRSCFFGCPLEQPLLVGAHERIEVTGPGDDLSIEVESSDSDVLEIGVERSCYCENDNGSGGRIEIDTDASCESPRSKHCDNSLPVHALSAGEATIELKDRRGNVIDRAEVLVREADHAKFFGKPDGAVAELEAENFEVEPDQKLELEVELYDEDGQKLLAPDGVHWSTSDAEVATMEAFLLGSGAELDAGLSIVVTSHAAGEAEITVDVPGLSTSVGLSVVE